MSRVMWIAVAAACSGQPAPAPRSAPPHVAIAVDAGPPPDGRPLDQDLPRLVERSLAMYDDIARALAGSDDCGAAAGRLGQLAAGYRDVVTANAKVLHDGRARELRAALDPHGDAFDASAQAIMHSPTIAKCSQDPVFARAFDELLEPPP